MKYIIANWKAHKNLNEAALWIDAFLSKIDVVDSQGLSEKQIIIAPSYPLLPVLNAKISGWSFIKLAAQDLSSFNEGEYTGDVTAKALKDLIDYVIVGHSERRKYHKETEREIENKITRAIEQSITPILCVRGESDVIYQEVGMVALEPTDAIGTGRNTSLKEVLETKKKLSLPNDSIFLYGGSVDSNNIAEYTDPDIQGFLVGKASSDPEEFFKIVQAV